MTIEVRFRGNLGNHLFQYTFARLLAERNGFELASVLPDQAIVRTTPHRSGRRNEGPITWIRDLQEVSESWTEAASALSRPLSPARYMLDGYFQNPDFYNLNEREVRSFFALDPVSKNTDDLVMNVRLGNYDTFLGGRILHPSFYTRILEQESFKRLHIVGVYPGEPYLRAFRRYSPIVIPPDPAPNFHYLRSFDRIICSNSTFCWWAAFLSDASRIYTHHRWLDVDGRSDPRRFRQRELRHATAVDSEYCRDYHPLTHYGPKVGRVRSLLRRVPLLVAMYRRLRYGQWLAPREPT